MSLIEQAARRLEELRRAGAEVPENPASDPVSTLSDEPTPEALIRMIDGGPPELRREPYVDPFRPRRANKVDASEAGNTARRSIELNLPQMRARGFITPDAAKSQMADEFRVIKRPIIRNALGQGTDKIKHGNLVMVTSALPREGKTFTSVNLAMSVAMEYDSTVLLVDGDVAHPSFPSLLGCPPGPGLLDLLAKDDVDVGDALVRTNVEKLTLLPSGSRHRRSTELLASEQMASLLRELASRYSDRIVIFDSPPLLPTTEARVLATHMGQIVMVVAADTTSQHAVAQALATIESCEIVMMMLNKASRTGVGTYYGYYGYGDDAQ
jgi:exopolysaccharide/PEP-CTERM locus tyrosine autokinase